MFCCFLFSERIDLINSLADLKLDNKRLQEMNKALQLQMEHSEENLKEIQSENKELKQQIKEYVKTWLCKVATYVALYLQGGDIMAVKVDRIVGRIGAFC